MSDFHRTMQYPTEHGEISIAYHIALRNDHNYHILNPLCNLKNVDKRYRPYRDNCGRVWRFYVDWNMSITALRRN